MTDMMALLTDTEAMEGIAFPTDYRPSDPPPAPQGKPLLNLSDQEELDGFFAGFDAGLANSDFPISGPSISPEDLAPNDASSLAPQYFITSHTHMQGQPPFVDPNALEVAGGLGTSRVQEGSILNAAHAINNMPLANSGPPFDQLAQYTAKALPFGNHLDRANAEQTLADTLAPSLQDGYPAVWNSGLPSNSNSNGNSSANPVASRPMVRFGTDSHFQPSGYVAPLGTTDAGEQNGLQRLSWLEGDAQSSAANTQPNTQPNTEPSSPIWTRRRKDEDLPLGVQPGPNWPEPETKGEPARGNKHEMQQSSEQVRKKRRITPSRIPAATTDNATTILGPGISGSSVGGSSNNPAGQVANTSPPSHQASNRSKRKPSNIQTDALSHHFSNLPRSPPTNSSTTMSLGSTYLSPKRPPNDYDGHYRVMPTSSSSSTNTLESPRHPAFDHSQDGDRPHRRNNLQSHFDSSSIPHSITANHDKTNNKTLPVNSHSHSRSHSRSHSSTNTHNASIRIPLTTDQKRLNHTNSEQRRRDQAQRAFARLFDLVPELHEAENRGRGNNGGSECSGGGGSSVKKMSQMKKLERVVQKVRELQEGNEKLKTIIEGLERQDRDDDVTKKGEGKGMGSDIMGVNNHHKGEDGGAESESHDASLLQ